MGDRVEILTAKQENPSRDWMNPHLGYLHTARARAKVHHWFKQQDFEKNALHGEATSDHEIKRSRQSTLPESKEVLQKTKQILPTKAIPIPGVLIEGVGDLLTHTARCCKPVPGDSIVGFITRTRGVSIHRRDCFNVLQASSTNQ